MNILFLAIQQYLLAQLTSLYVNYIRVWNNQFQDIVDGKQTEFALTADGVSTPAVFIEFPDEIEYRQLGNGVQTVDPLDITLHFLYEFYDNGQLNAGEVNGQNMGQNLEVLAMAETVFQKFQEYMPTTATFADGPYAGTYQIPLGVVYRVGEMQSKNYNNVYHFKQRYRTTWIDSKMNRPVGGILAPDDTELNATIQNPS